MEMEKVNGKLDNAFAKMPKNHGMRLLMFCEKEMVGLILSALLNSVIKY